VEPSIVDIRVVLLGKIVVSGCPSGLLEFLEYKVVLLAIVNVIEKSANGTGTKTTLWLGDICNLDTIVCTT
jgi:hypothetical protein